MEEFIATAVHKEPFSLKKIFSRCFPVNKHCEEDEQMISAIRLQISVNDTKGCRKITLKGLYGDY